MKAPTEKKNDICQMIVTRSCDLFNCSNCTQLLPFRKDTLHMSVDCFRKAVQSMKGWPGVVALFGGNPCTHPEFPTLCAILAEEVPNQAKRGLWTNDFLEHGQVVKDTFYPNGRFNLNAHGDPEAAARMEKWCPGKVIPESKIKQAIHTPVIMDYRDLGMAEEEWVALRENCDINQLWSSAIIEGPDGEPKAYFCEVAAALDGVRKESHGIPAEVGWWAKSMDFFQDQVSQCCDRGCGVPLKKKGHLAREGVYDVTRAWSKIRFKGKITRHVHEDMAAEACETGTDYYRRWTK